MAVRATALALLPALWLASWAAWQFWSRRLQHTACEMTYMYPSWREVPAQELLGSEDGDGGAAAAPVTSRYRLFHFTELANPPGACAVRRQRRVAGAGHAASAHCAAAIYTRSWRCRLALN